jgi:hypothetical protein
LQHFREGRFGSAERISIKDHESATLGEPPLGVSQELLRIHNAFG